MIGRTNVGGGGGGTVIVTIHGACAATVSITGAATASLLLDAAGNGSIILKKGNYTFTDSVSGFSVQQAITESTDVNLWYAEKTMLYWYGREFEELTGGWSSVGLQSQAAYPAGGTAVKDTNKMTVAAASGKSCCFATLNPVTPSAQIHFRCQSPNDYLYFGASTDKANLQSTRNATGYMRNSSIANHVAAFTSEEQTYPSFFEYNSTNVGTVYEIWMD